MARVTPGWTTPEEQAEKHRRYEDELVHRYENRLSLSVSDRREARRIIKDRSARETKRAMRESIL